MNGVTPVGETQLVDYLWRIANLLIDVGIVYFVIHIAKSGYIFQHSANNPTRRAESAMALFWNILGGIVTVGAKFFGGIILGFKP